MSASDNAMAASKPVRVVFTPGGYRAWALGAFRAETSPCSSDRKRWWWRVWHVLGPNTLCRGDAMGVRRATEAALLYLVDIASV